MIHNKVFDMVVFAVLLVAAILVPMLYVNNYILTYVDSRMVIQKAEIQECIYNALSDLKTDAEWQFILKTLLNMKRLTYEQGFKMATIIQNGCKRVGISVDTFLALMMVESEMDSKCLFRGAKGICQVMDITQLEAIGIVKDYKWDDPIKNTSTCLRYFDYMREKVFINTTDELELCRGYNVGPYSRDALHGDAANRYVRKILYYKDVMK